MRTGQVRRSGILSCITITRTKSFHEWTACRRGKTAIATTWSRGTRPLSDFLCGSESALLEKLAVRLSVVPLERVDYDIVWGKKRTLALYVSAKLAT